jgi:hypothetical protein
MSKKRLLLVGWDSADWKIMHPMIDAGHLPGVAHRGNPCYKLGYPVVAR